MSESITKFISTIKEVSMYLPRFSGDDMINNHVGWWFGYLYSGYDYSFNSKTPSYTKGATNNVFIRDVLEASDTLSRPLMYLLVIPEKSTYEKSIVRAINDDTTHHALKPELISQSVLNGNRYLGYSSFSNYAYDTDKNGFLSHSINRKCRSIKIKPNKHNLKYYVIYDDVNMNTLKLLHSKNLETNIIAVSCSMHELRGSGIFGTKTISNYIKNELGVDKNAKIDGDDIPTSIKLTNVMKNLITEYGYSEETWYSKRDKIDTDGRCKISFQFNNNSKDATKFLMNEFDKNDILPLRLKWSRGSSDTIVGGIVLCPELSKTKLKNKLKLFGIKSMHDTYDLNGIRGLMMKHEKI